MTGKRFKLLYSKLDNGMFVDREKQFEDIIVDKEFQKIGLIKLVDLLNNLSEENEQLKQSNEYLQEQLEDYSGVEVDSTELREENEKLKQQLFYDGDGVCDICKHEYLTPSGDYFISNCRKGHEECSKEDLRYCKDFEVKELEE